MAVNGEQRIKPEQVLSDLQIPQVKAVNTSLWGFKMTQYVYSAKYNSFFPVELLEAYRDNLWDLSGVSEVEVEVVKEFMSEAPTGKERIAGHDGMPAWGDLPAPTQDELTTIASQKKAALRITADAEIAWRQDAIDAEIANENEIVDLTAWKKYRVLLMRVDTAAPVWPTPPEEQAS